MEPWVSYTEENQQVNYNKPHDYSKDYLTFEILSDGTFSWTCRWDMAGNYIHDICLKVNDGEWSTPVFIDEYSNLCEPINAFSVHSGDKIYVKRSKNSIQYNEGNKSFISGFADEGPETNCRLNVFGNILSLFSDDINDIDTQNILLYPASMYSDDTQDSMFIKLFSGLRIVSAENLILPFINLDKNVYSSPCVYASMFENCTELVKGPKLPATALTPYCYYRMFAGCSSLVEAPDLPAVTLNTPWYNYSEARGCYAQMFGAYSYYDYDMGDTVYTYCSSLKHVKCMAVTETIEDYTTGGVYGRWWMEGVSPTGVFIKNKNMNSWPTGNYGIPSGWAVQDA